MPCFAVDADERVVFGGATKFKTHPTTAEERRACGRVLIPATSYLYAVWEANKFEPLEILDLKIHAALELTSESAVERCC